MIILSLESVGHWTMQEQSEIYHLHVHLLDVVMELDKNLEMVLQVILNNVMMEMVQIMMHVVMSV